MKKTLNQSTLTNILNSTTVILVLTLIFIVNSINNTNSQIVSLKNEQIYITETVNVIAQTNLFLADTTKSYVSTGDTAYYDAFIAQTKLNKTIEVCINNIEMYDLYIDEATAINSLRTSYNSLIYIQQNAINSGSFQNAYLYLFGMDYINELIDFRSYQDEFTYLFNTRINSEISMIYSKLSNLTLLFYFFIVLIIAVQIASVILIYKKIFKPIKVITYEMQRFSNGDLSDITSIEPNSTELGVLVANMIKSKTVMDFYIKEINSNLELISTGNIAIKIDIDYIGDFAPIKESLNTIVKSLNDTLLQLCDIAMSLTDDSSKVLLCGKSIYSNTVEEKKSIGQLSSVVLNIAEKTEEDSGNAQQASDFASMASVDVKASNVQMDNVVIAMKDIMKKSDEIGKIIATIDEIAFQTNILALNAAVEAARAGSAGKGFAIVAEEVRNLASKSAKAAQISTELITDSARAVARGSKLVNKTASTLSNVIEKTTSVTQLMEKISLSADEQALGIEQVNQAIENIAEVLDDTSEISTEFKDSSDDVNEQAQTLKGLVDNFVLDENIVKIKNNQKIRLEQQAKLEEQLKKNEEIKNLNKK